MTFLEQLCQALNKQKVDYAIVGGYAVALLGAVRGTVDIDFVVRWEKSSLLKAEQALASLGLVSRLPISADEVFHFRDEYIENRNLIAWNFCHPQNPTQEVDLVINFDLSGAEVTTIQVGGVETKVLAKSVLIEMKRASGRPQDIEDIKALEKLEGE